MLLYNQVLSQKWAGLWATWWYARQEKPAVWGRESNRRLRGPLYVHCILLTVFLCHGYFLLLLLLEVHLPLPPHMKGLDHLWIGATHEAGLVETTVVSAWWDTTISLKGITPLSEASPPSVFLSVSVSNMESSSSVHPWSTSCWAAGCLSVSVQRSVIFPYQLNLFYCECW